MGFRMFRALKRRRGVEIGGDSGYLADTIRDDEGVAGTITPYEPLFLLGLFQGLRVVDLCVGITFYGTVYFVIFVNKNRSEFEQNDACYGDRKWLLYCALQTFVFAEHF